ncbi:MAG: hypothetical protein J6Y87_09145, partial [Muribaculaceae bacterium]|nr:hypothetical protein [Muribaculaceae bacterium]
FLQDWKELLNNKGGEADWLRPLCCIYKQVNPKSVIGVMMITTLIFEQMFFRFEGAMGFHCNRKAKRQMPKRKFVCA